ncbi:hypothetical protein [Alteromonas facilis]|uniref:hypothetical protein n=1 Tax=Alteromonas facilis TaxID=2048004 RepID=UPI000F5CDF8F|nr:hypothetical protein [Alteromonas facilis]
MSGASQIHGTVSSLDNEGRLSSRVFIDTDMRPVVHKTLGYAMEQYRYQDQGYVAEMSYLDLNGKLKNHATLQVAKFIYRYDDKGNILSAKAYDESGKETVPQWDPAH